MMMMMKIAPKDSLTLLPCFYFVELPIVVSSMVSLYLLELTQVLTPAQGGFSCHQPGLSLPYVDPGDELIPLLMLLSLAFSGPAAAIMVGEGLVYSLQARLKVCPGTEGSITANGCSFNSFLRRTVRFVGVHLFGLCATALVTDVIQLATGYHAPFFLTVCKPNYTLMGVSCELNPYITKDICSGHDQQAILAARKTFPSQHATLSAFAAVYVSMYLNSTIPDSTRLLKPVLVFVFCIAALLSGLTQITQYRSHAVDVYVGFLIGAFIATYLAYHAVANFQPSEDVFPAAPSSPKADALRALAERGHDSVYNKGPASASESNDEISAVPAGGLGRGERACVESLKRSSVDVELLAPRSPMGKETMVTFSHTLPRASMDVPADPGADGGAEEPVQPILAVQRRLKPVQAPTEPAWEWQQKSTETRGVGQQGDGDASEEGVEVGPEGRCHVPVYPPVVQPGRPANANPPATPHPRAGCRVAAAPTAPQTPEAGPPAVSPKSALTRAKWLAITARPPRGDRGNQPRLMQVIAMSRQPGLLPPSSGTSSAVGPSAEQPPDGCSVPTVDAHARRRAAAPGARPPPWEWRGASDGPDPLNDHGSVRRAPRVPRDDAAAGGQRRGEASLRRKGALVLLDQPQQDNHAQKMHGGRRSKD